MLSIADIPRYLDGRSTIIDDVEAVAYYRYQEVDPVDMERQLNDTFSREEFQRLDECTAFILRAPLEGKPTITYYISLIDCDNAWADIQESLMSTPDYDFEEDEDEDYEDDMAWYDDGEYEEE